VNKLEVKRKENYYSLALGGGGGGAGSEEGGGGGRESSDGGGGGGGAIPYNNKRWLIMRFMLKAYFKTYPRFSTR
jgi:hypothetical protein